MPQPLVSVVIPTYNRCDLLLKSIRSVLAQTMPVEEIIVIDDGSTDDTGEVLRREFGDRLTYVYQDNAGVSAARNRGLAMARGRYLSLLDSDDIWLPEKTARQVEWLEAHPDYGMVLCDVHRVDKDGKTIDFFRRHTQIPEDGMVLRWVLRYPALAPVSIMLRRAAFETVGGFDTSLRTAEDLDFHLRVARRWPIGVIPEVLVRAMRGHDGLSSLSQTYDDDQLVIERFVADCRGEVPDRDLNAGLAAACLRNAKGCLYQHRYWEARRLAWRALRYSTDWRCRRQSLALLPLAFKRMVSRMWKRTMCFLVSYGLIDQVEELPHLMAGLV